MTEDDFRDYLDDIVYPKWDCYDFLEDEANLIDWGYEVDGGLNNQLRQ